MAKQAKAAAAKSAAVYQQVPVTDLTGGLDLRQEPTLLPTEKSRALVNWSLSTPGALTVRPGFLAHTQVLTSTQSSVFGTGPLMGGQRVYLNTNLPTRNSTAFTLVSQNGLVILLGDSGGVLTSTGSLSTSAPIHFLHDRDLVIAMDGASTRIVKSTNGSSWTRFGIASGSSGTPNSTAGGALSSGAEYELNYSYKDRDLVFESNGSSSPSTITVSSVGSTQAIRYVVPNSTDAQVEAIVVYARNVTSGETIRRKASSQVQSGGVSSTILITSSNWTSNDEEPSDHDLPPTLAFGVVWKNRWWARHGTIGNRLHFTQIFQPQAWPSLFYIDIPFDLGDEIRAIDAIGDTLILHGATKAFVILGQTSLDFEVRPALGSQEGALGPRATARVESSLIHAGAAGVYSFDGATDRLLTRDIEPAWRDLLRNATVADLEQLSVVYDGFRKEVRVAVPRRYPSAAPGEFVLDLNRSQQDGDTVAWTETDRPIRGYIVWDGPEAATGNRGRLFSWASVIPWVFEEAVGTTANGSDMVATYQGSGLTLGVRVGRWVDVRGEYEPNQGTLTVESSIDGVPQGPRTVTIGAGQAVYDTSLYDVAVYPGAGRRVWHTNLPLGAEGRTLTQTLVYTGQADFTHFGYRPGVVPEVTSRDFNG